MNNSCDKVYTKENKDKLFENYAQLILARGVGLAPGQILVVEETSVTSYEFLRVLAKKAYEMGAKDVVIHYSDQDIMRSKLEHASVEDIANVPDWWVDARTSYGKKGACFLRLNNDSPDGLNGVDKDKLATWKKATTEPLKDLAFIKKDNLVKWSASALAGKEWAKKVFPDLSEDEAMDALWDAILKCCYVTLESGVDGWDAHVAEMRKNVEKINALKVRKLHLANSLGTDITMELCDDAIFTGGICHCPEPDGELFAPNIPSEEILSTPHKYKVNGVIYSSMPFVYAGNIIDGMRLVFTDGKVTDYSAAVGQDILKGILETDEGSCYAGEIALVPFDSPINQLGVLFYNTLFDENASCHMALGAGYSDMIMGSDRSMEALTAKGLNLSALHVDFMFGTEDLSCVVTGEDGKETEIFKDGAFCL